MLKEELGLDTEFVKGDAGVFDVCLGDRRVFSKHESGRFPEDAEVVELLREAAPASA